MLYDLFGDRVEIVRFASADDVRSLGPRDPTPDDLELLAAGRYVVVVYAFGSPHEHLHLVSYLSADGGDAEVAAALESVGREARDAAGEAGDGAGAAR